LRIGDAAGKASAARFEGLPDVHSVRLSIFVDEAGRTGISKWCLTGPKILERG
jgi:hypothetical protein